MKDFVHLLRALADENRLRVLFALEKRELCACELAQLLRLAPSTVSQHMSILRRAGLVAVEKRGRWMYYRRIGRQAAPAVRRALSFVRFGLQDAPSSLRKREGSTDVVHPDAPAVRRRPARSDAGRSGSAKRKAEEGGKRWNDPGASSFLANSKRSSPTAEGS